MNGPIETAEFFRNLFSKNRSLPNGGPRMMVLYLKEEQHWTVGDGTWHYGQFSSQQKANAALKAAGFRGHRFLSENTVYWHTY